MTAALGDKQQSAAGARSLRRDPPTHPPRQPGPPVTISSTDLTAHVADRVAPDFSHYPGLYEPLAGHPRQPTQVRELRGPWSSPKTAQALEAGISSSTRASKHQSGGVDGPTEMTGVGATQQRLQAAATQRRVAATPRWDGPGAKKAFAWRTPSDPPTKPGQPRARRLPRSVRIMRTAKGNAPGRGKDSVGPVRIIRESR